VPQQVYGAVLCIGMQSAKSMEVMQRLVVVASVSHLTATGENLVADFGHFEGWRSNSTAFRYRIAKTHNRTIAYGTIL
jgi:hypothetical protein